MTRKDYIKAADLIGYHGIDLPLLRRAEQEILYATFVRLFAADNPRFDADRFRAACGLPSDKG